MSPPQPGAFRVFGIESPADRCRDVVADPFEVVDVTYDVLVVATLPEARSTGSPRDRGLERADDDSKARSPVLDADDDVDMIRHHYERIGVDAWVVRRDCDEARARLGTRGR